MFSFLPGPIIGIFALLIYSINVIFWPWPVYLVALIKFIPFKPLQNACNYFFEHVPTYWADVNRVVMKLTSKVKIEVIGLEQLKADDWYYMVCNHQSWIDIMILEEVFSRTIPAPKIFMKKEVLWSVPFAGYGATLLNFPVMQRYTREYLAKHPEQKGKDLETTRKACEKFKDRPTTILSFVEGTRFTEAKRIAQNSPYKHLLRPKAGGMAFAFQAMGEYFHKVIDVTIIYPDNDMNVWKFSCGKVKKVIVKIDAMPIPKDLLGDYENDEAFKLHFQKWLNSIWKRKDEFISNNPIESSVSSSKIDNDHAKNNSYCNSKE